jgi:hypothetical protein
MRPLANDLSLTAREISIITAWVDGGTPRGDPSDLPVPETQEVWPLGAPDLELPLPRQNSAGDRPIVQRITVPTRLRTTQWLRGFDVRPGDRRALRSVFLFLKDGGKERWLGGWTPWQSMTHTAFDTAYRLPANATLLVEFHYKNPTGQEEPVTDTSTLGLYLKRQPPAAALEDLTIAVRPVKDGRRPARLSGEMRLARDTAVWAFRPRLADERGGSVSGSIEIKAIGPDGAIEPLLWLRENSEDWQYPYFLRDPLELARGSRLVVTAYPARSDGTSAIVSILGYAAREAARK